MNWKRKLSRSLKSAEKLALLIQKAQPSWMSSEIFGGLRLWCLARASSLHHGTLKVAVLSSMTFLSVMMMRCYLRHLATIAVTFPWNIEGLPGTPEMGLFSRAIRQPSTISSVKNARHWNQFLLLHISPQIKRSEDRIFWGAHFWTLFQISEIDRNSSSLARTWWKTVHVWNGWTSLKLTSGHCCSIATNLF